MSGGMAGATQLHTAGYKSGLSQCTRTDRPLQRARRPLRVRAAAATATAEEVKVALPASAKVKLGSSDLLVSREFLVLWKTVWGVTSVLVETLALCRCAPLRVSVAWRRCLTPMPRTRPQAAAWEP